jgi:radical SAM protein with 4Fe4S-binding SPASM domain
MRKDLFVLFDHARNRGVITALATNATLIDSSLAHKLASAGVPRVSVSLDGASAQTHDQFRGQAGSFDAAVAGIRSLRNAKIDVQINVTFTRRNHQDAIAMLDLAQHLGACAVHVFLLVPVGCGVDLPESIRLTEAEVERLLTLFDTEATKRDFEIRATCAPQAQRIRRQRAADRKRAGHPEGRGLAPSSKGCLAGGGILFVDAVGKVFPCGYLPISVGDIRQANIKQILEQSTVLSQLRDTSLLEGRCSGCDYAAVCGGCRARSYGSRGTLFGEEPTCPMSAQRRHSNG